MSRAKKVEALQELLGKLDACRGAKRFADGKTFAEAWNLCDRPDWLQWIIYNTAGTPGFPTRDQVNKASKEYATEYCGYGGCVYCITEGIDSREEKLSRIRKLFSIKEIPAPKKKTK